MLQNSTPSDAFYEICQVSLDGINDNMSSLFYSGKYAAINTTDTATNRFYVIFFTSEVYILQDNRKGYGQIINAGELVVLKKCSMQADTNCYWNKNPQQNIITVPTCTILHQQLEVNAVTYFHEISKSVCNRTQ